MEIFRNNPMLGAFIPGCICSVSDGPLDVGGGGGPVAPPSDAPHESPAETVARFEQVIQGADKISRAGARLTKYLRTLKDQSEKAQQELRQAKRELAEANRTIAELREENERLRRAKATVDWTGLEYLSPEGREGFSKYVTGGARQATERLRTLYYRRRDDNPEDITNALWEAINLFRTRQDIKGAASFATETVETLRSAHSKDKEVRGFTLQAIRSAQLINLGRNLHSIEYNIVRNFTCPEFYIDMAAGKVKRSSKTYSFQRVDATEGETMIEVKGTKLCGEVGTFLKKLLNGGEVKFDPNTQRERVDIAVNMANQMHRYRKLIDIGFAERIEFHITARDGIPDELVDAIHRFFNGNASIYWYENTLSSGKLLSPKTSESSVPMSVQAKKLGKELSITSDELRSMLQSYTYGGAVFGLLDHNEGQAQAFMSMMMETGRWNVAVAMLDQENALNILRTTVGIWKDYKAATDVQRHPMGDDTARTIAHQLIKKHTGTTNPKHAAGNVMNVEINLVRKTLLNMSEGAKRRDAALAKSLDRYAEYLEIQYGSVEFFDFATEETIFLDLIKRYLKLYPGGQS